MVSAGSFLTANWRSLAMLNYEIPPETLLPYVPEGTELDTFEGITYASMVGFLFLNTRVLGMAIPFHREFEEVNLRFYVRRRAPEGWRRGVVFIKEIVPKRGIAAIARSVYGENYIRLPMRHQRDRVEIGYEWLIGGRWNGLHVRICGEPALPAAGSAEEFIIQHYWGYTAQRHETAREYRVEHVPWRVWQVDHATLTCEAEHLYGPGFAEALSGPPRSAFLAEGSPITVYRADRIALP
ncbi:MAG: DUF2071 domain-containing protein [Bryobacteraceae bacterium]